jgi:hypothetical protein
VARQCHGTGCRTGMVVTNVVAVKVAPIGTRAAMRFSVRDRLTDFRLPGTARVSFSTYSFPGL